MMGRWPSGAPIVKYPDQDPARASIPTKTLQKFINDNDFLYNHNNDTKNDDKHGIQMPIWRAYRRARTNPRDSFEENTQR